VARASDLQLYRIHDPRGGDILRRWLAAAIAERANDRLWAYCRYHETEAWVLRPVAIDELLPTILKSRLILAFITGHEIGHLVQASEDPGTQPLFDWVAARHDAINTDRKDPKLPFERFLEPEVTQKFDTDGVPTGFSIQTTKFARQFLHMRRQQIQETQADALGVILATHTAIDAGIAVEDLFGFFPKILEHTDMLMMLRRTVARLPRGEKSSAIATERSSLFARLCLYLQLVRGLRDGAVDAPAEVVAYWSSLAEQDLVTMERAANDGTLDVLAMRAALMCRGGIEVGLHGKLSDPLPDDYHDLGPFGGNLSMAYAHRQLPDWLFRIETSFDWEPDDVAADAVVYGFAGAIRDITEISASETRLRWSVGRRDIMREGSDAVFVELLRSARRQTVGRQLDTWWLGFETILRHRHEPARPA
jgi:hypothetical protein